MPHPCPLLAHAERPSIPRFHGGYPRLGRIHTEGTSLPMANPSRGPIGVYQILVWNADTLILGTLK